MSSFKLTATSAAINYGSMGDPQVKLETLQTGVRSSFTMNLQPSNATISSMLQNEAF